LSGLGTSEAGRALVFAVDYDRTLTGPSFAPDPAAIAAIADLRAAGIRCVLLTGRSMADLATHPVLATAFDAYCLEGGAQWGAWGDLIGPNNAAQALAAAGRVEAEGIAVQRRVASFTCSKGDLAAVQRLAADCSIQVDRDRVDVLPSGLDKGIGIDAVLSHLSLRNAHVVALGDGENDVPLLEGAEVGLATADAVDELKAVADEVLQGSGPAAVVEASRRLLAGEWRELGRDPPAGPAGTTDPRAA
jgi:hydroxymethylpyrimidine pyrophosphatase-like HAD family hydrolase